MKYILFGLISFISSFSIQAQKPDDKVYVVVEEFAEFPGGVTKLREFLSANIQYPEKTQEENAKVLVTFVVSNTGVISDIEIKRGISDCQECDTEAIRLISIMPIWKPAKNNGKAVNSQFILPISFS